MPDAEDKKDETSKADKADTSEASDKSATPTVGQRATGEHCGFSYKRTTATSLTLKLRHRYRQGSVCRTLHERKAA